MMNCIQVTPNNLTLRIKKQGKVHKLFQDSEGNNMCPYCDFTSLKKSTVSEHITRIHPKEAGRQINPFQCKHCGEKFQNKSAELQHVKNHHEITMFNCPFQSCPFQAKNTTTLCTHYSRKHLPNLTASTSDNDTVICTICKKNMKKSTSYYHIAKCCPTSHFFTGSVMHDDSDEIILFKPPF